MDKDAFTKPSGSDPGIEQSSSYPYDTARVRELLKSKRRHRVVKSCFPCRHRKVRCDGDVPCSSCVRGGHAELCGAPRSSDMLGKGGGGINDLPRAFEGEIGGDRNEHRQIVRYVPYRISISLCLCLCHLICPSSVRANDTEATGSGALSASISDTPDVSSMIRRLENIEEQISCLKADLQQTQSGTYKGGPQMPERASSSRRASRPDPSPGKLFFEDTTGATVYLGSHSDPPATLGLNDAILIDQLAARTYPFTNLWRPGAGALEICQTLPDDENIIRYWQAYQTCAYPFYPVPVTYKEFTTSLFSFLDQRATLQANSDGDWSSLDDIDSSWLALLFAILASGVQLSNDPIKERDLKTKVFICSSFQCLRTSNFFINTDMNQIQAMALIGHCLGNNLDTNSAWILMGSALRLAQSIGLHDETVSAGSYSPTDQLQRKRLWWMLLLQDTFLSLTYDRPRNITKSNSSIPSDPDTVSGYSFAESMFSVCQIELDRTRQEDSESVAAALAAKRRLEKIFESASSFLVEKHRCHTLQDHLERLALRIHVSYGVCRFLRLALETAASSGSDSLELDSNTLTTECIDHAEEAVEAFLDMHRLSSTVCRLWAFVHNAVSCAITLRNMGAATTVTGDFYRPRADTLVQRLISVLRREELHSVWEDSDTNVRYFGPYSRALKALTETVCGEFF
ncbi:Transcription factor [Penicillium lagena]|uniref:Transcription factor n=1 Tax=Penicillium lagena TaxID=94218 RepID=UPI00254111DC|nr:Transcription factor [Penicillium lagena]KAJ5623789.1 Transcription factor [Penicillium lagena]